MLMSLLGISVPTLTVLIGILLNRDAVNRLDARITALEAIMRAEVSGLRADMSNLRGDMSNLRSDMSNLRAEMASLRSTTHSDLILLLERDNKLESRVAQLKRIA